MHVLNWHGLEPHPADAQQVSVTVQYQPSDVHAVQLPSYHGSGPLRGTGVSGGAVGAGVTKHALAFWMQWPPKEAGRHVLEPQLSVRQHVDCARQYHPPAAAQPGQLPLYFGRGPPPAKAAAPTASTATTTRGSEVAMNIAPLSSLGTRQNK